jgi:hypothetical protein
MSTSTTEFQSEGTMTVSSSYVGNPGTLQIRKNTDHLVGNFTATDVDQLLLLLQEALTLVEQELNSGSPFGDPNNGRSSFRVIQKTLITGTLKAGNLEKLHQLLVEEISCLPY